MLIKYEGEIGRQVAADTLRNGNFLFRIPLTEAKMFTLTLAREGNYTPLPAAVWGAPDKETRFSMDGNNYRIESEVPEQREWDRYADASRQETDRIWEINAERITLLQRRQRASPEEAVTINFSLDSLLQITNGLSKTRYRNDLEILNETPVSAIWLNRLHEISRMIRNNDYFADLARSARVQYDRLTPEQRNEPIARQIGIDLSSSSATLQKGDAMADTELYDLEGRLHRLSGFKGKYILLDFWSSGCAPCFASMPELREIKEKYPDELTIIGINIDTKEQNWRDATGFFGPTWTNLNAPQGNELTARYGVKAVPHQVLISPGGIILDSWSGYYPGKVEEELKKYTGKE